MSEAIQNLRAVMARLRDPETGCPWDLKQDWKSIVPHTLEEAYEVADAIERENFSAIREELGDLLFQVVFYAHLAEEEQRFDFDMIAQGMADKLVARHPHVFGDEPRTQTDAALHKAWEESKQAERVAKGERAESALDGVTRGLPALSYATKLQKRAARVGFDWPDFHGVLDKVEEEIGELREELVAEAPIAERIDAELGDLLFALVNLARHTEVDAEGALRRASQRFDDRFRLVETELAGAGRGLDTYSIEELEAAWQRAKQALAAQQP